MQFSRWVISATHALFHACIGHLVWGHILALIVNTINTCQKTTHFGLLLIKFSITVHCSTLWWVGAIWRLLTSSVRSKNQGSRHNCWQSVPEGDIINSPGFFCVLEFFKFCLSDLLLSEKEKPCRVRVTIVGSQCQQERSSILWLLLSSHFWRLLYLTLLHEYQALLEAYCSLLNIKSYIKDDLKCQQES